jgi:hypothetical protein
MWQCVLEALQPRVTNVKMDTLRVEKPLDTFSTLGGYFTCMKYIRVTTE